MAFTVANDICDMVGPAVVMSTGIFLVCQINVQHQQQRIHIVLYSRNCANTANSSGCPIIN